MVGFYFNVKRMNRLFFIVLFISIQITAAPFKNVPIKIIQPSGSVIKCFVSGDEYYNWVHTQDGYTILQNSQTGYYVYATKVNEKLEPTNYIVGVNDDKRFILEKYLINPPKTVEEIRKNQPLKTQQIQSNNSINKTLTPTKGVIDNIVIFIRFSDEMELNENKIFYDSLFNSSKENVSSMYNYFNEVSYNKLKINSSFFPQSTTNVISYQDPHPRKFFVEYNSTTNPLGYSGGINGSERFQRETDLLANAINSVKDQIPSNLNIDSDENGTVDNVCFIISGNAEGWSSILWPHQCALTYNPNYTTINGKIVLNYNVQIEELLKTMGVGVLCHEMFHSLGAPDLYHYNYDGISPVGEWDIMGCETVTAQHMGVYMKQAYGNWINNIDEIKEGGRFFIKPSTSQTKNSYIIRSPFSFREYFLVEYRKRNTIFENSLPGEGLLVYRICPFNIGDVGSGQGIADEVYLFRQSGSLTQDGDITKANFAREASRTIISDSTSSALFLFKGGKTGIKIFDVGACGDSIGFSIKYFSQNNISPMVLSPRPPELSSCRREILTDIWKAGSQEEIKWSGFNCDKINIDLSTNGGINWTSIASGVTTNQNMFLWNIPNLQSTTCLMKISNSANSLNTAVSDTFSICQFKKVNKITYNSLTAVGEIDKNNIWIGSRNVQFFHSEDAGENWKDEFLPEAGGIIRIYSYNNILWIITGSLDGSATWLLRSSDLGKNWEKINVPTHDQLNEIMFTDKDVGYCAGWNSRIIKTTDGGNTWKELPFNFGSRNFESVYFVNRNVGWLTENLVFKTTDGGNSWQKCMESTSGNIYLDSFFLNEKIGWVVGSAWDNSKMNMVVMKTIDGGTTWQKTILPNNGFLRKVSFIDCNNGWAVGDGGTIYKTTDGGGIWRRVESGTSITIFDFFAGCGNIICVGDGGLILKSAYVLSGPEKPNLIFPTNGLKNLNNQLELKWNNVQNAETYYAQVAKNNNFTCIVIFDSTKFNTSKQIVLNDQGIKYFWRVAAKDSGGSDAWSECWNFTTALPSPNQLSANLDKPGEVKLTWKDNSNGEHGFVVERKKTTENNYSAIETTLCNVMSFTDKTVNAGYTYSYRIKAFTNDAESDYSNKASAVVTNVNNESVPTVFSLQQNYPNPFNPTTTIKFTLPKESKVKLCVYNTLGEKVAELVNEYMSAGYYNIKWGSANLSSGVYFYLLEVIPNDGGNSFQDVKKMILMK